MITVKIGENDELVISGQIEVGEKINGLCCDGFDCEAVWIANFDRSDPNDTSAWYICESPSHDAERVLDMYAGVNSKMIEDIALFLVDLD